MDIKKINKNSFLGTKNNNKKTFYFSKFFDFLHSVLKNFYKKKKFIWISGLICILFGGAFLFRVIQTRGASFSWFSTTWSGGADTVSVATHTSNQTGWTKYYSKDSNVNTTSVDGQISLSSVNNTSVTTSDADFNAGTNSNTYVSGNAVYAKKPDGGSCTADNQCVNGWCLTNVCSNPWLSGPCSSSILVYKGDVTYGLQWKTTQTNCVSPQCSLGLDTYSGMSGKYGLVASNNVDFSVYPMRNECKNIGGRLPTLTELNCIRVNQASYSTYNAIQNASYFSSTEENVTSAMVMQMGTGATGGASKTSTVNYYTRCVK